MSSDLTVTGINNAQKLMVDSAIRIAHYIKEHPVPPKDFEIKGALSSSEFGKASVAPQSVNALKQAKAPEKNGTPTEDDPTQLLPKPVVLPKYSETKPKPDETAGESHPATLPDPVSKDVEQANNVILFFKGRQEVLINKAKAKANDAEAPSSNFFADLRA
jgi:hypothetical protein